MKSLTKKEEARHEFHPEVLRQHRKARRENQSCFWERFGVTQSRGSRFETGAELPPPVVILLRLYHEGTITDADLCRIQQRVLIATPD